MSRLLPGLVSKASIFGPPRPMMHLDPRGLNVTDEREKDDRLSEKWPEMHDGARPSLTCQVRKDDREAYLAKS